MDTPNSTTNRLKEFGNWSEQISSSGKRYYYNSVSNVSQWEKPPEWKQAEKLRASSTNIVKNGNGLPIKGEDERGSPISNTATATKVQYRHTSNLTNNAAHFTQHTTITANSSTLPALKLDSSLINNAISSSTPSLTTTTSPSSAKRPRLGLVEDNRSVVPTTKIVSSTTQIQSHKKTTTVTNNNTIKPRPLNSIDTSAVIIKESQSISNNNASDRVKSITMQMKLQPPTEKEQRSPTEKITVEGFREDRYHKHWRPEMALVSRRALGFELFTNDLKKCTDKSQKHTTGIFALDRDIHSIRTLYQTAHLRSKLLKQRLDAVRERIQELDCKGQ